MHNHKHCPECDSTSTEILHTDYHHSTIERVRTCLDCPTQYTVSYGMPEITNVTEP